MTTQEFTESFDDFDQSIADETWLVSNFAISANFIDTAWSADNVLTGDGFIDLELDKTDSGGKSFTGAEIKTNAEYLYGRYEVTMRPSGHDGVLSSFFVFTGEHFGDPRSEIDFEFIGGDTTEVLLSYHTAEGSDGLFVDLGFDAADAEHVYAFEWGPDSISWYVDDVLLRTVEDPEIGTPNQPGQIYANIWTGSNSFTGTATFPDTATARYSEVSFTARTAPLAFKDRADLTAGETAVIDVLANDEAPNGSLDPASVAIDQPPANGVVSVDPVTGEITYTPNPGFRGIDEFSYTVSDGTEVSNSGNVLVTVDVPVHETFFSGAEGFVYSDDAFRGTAEPDYASGVAADGVLRVTLGGGSTKSTITDISGGWSTSFDSAAGQSGTLTLRVRLDLTGDLDAGEYAEVLVAVDGTEWSVLRIDATDDDNEALDSGFVDVVVDLGALGAGSHTLTLGGYLNQRTRANESAVIEFDAVDLALTAPSPADDDGNLALAAPDLDIDGAEAGTVSFIVSGLDDDADAVVTVTDGLGATVSGAIAADGTIVLDLSGLADGPLATAVTATDGDGATATVQGPQLTLTQDATPPAEISFAGETRALSIDLETGAYSFATKVMAIGDSLTHGYLGGTDTVTTSTRNLQEGYRGDLFESLLAQDQWIDFVGDRSAGPAGMLDTDHQGTPGLEFRQIANNHLKSKVQQFAPEIGILRAGTNDFNANETLFFDTHFDRIMTSLDTSVRHFFSAAPAGADLIIATIPPRLNFGDEFLSRIVNEGYSIVNGEEVVGDAGNGTYKPGIIGVTNALKATFANLHLYEAPFDVADLGDDNVHLTDEAYAAFAAGLEALIETEIGYSGGTIGGQGLALGAGNSVEGGEAGDLIAGSSAADTIRGGAGNDALKGRAGNDVLDGEEGADRIEGGAGADTVTGGADADVFVFASDFADGAGGLPDEITDFGNGADRIAFADAFEGLVTVADDGAGVLLTVGDGLGGTAGEIHVDGAAAQNLKGADLGGGVFALTDDDTLVFFVTDTNYLIS